MTRVRRRPLAAPFAASLTALAAAGFLVLAAPRAEGQDAPKAEAKDEKPEPKTEPVTKGPFSVVLDLTGVFDAVGATEVLFDAEHWSGELEIVEVAAPGPVAQGQTLVRFATDKVDEQLAAAERDLAIARLAFQKQSEDAKRQEEASAVAMKRLELEAAAAETAWKRFDETDRELRLKEADMRLQQTRDNLKDQEEELAQLEKMYHADELTEETEDIVLKRTKRQIERSRFWLASQVIRDEWWRKTDFPREGEQLDTNRRKATLDLERARATQQATAETQRLELEKARTNLAKQEDTFAKLQRDRQKFTLTAPAAGHAVWGTLTKGKWSGLEPPPAAHLVSHRAKAKPGQVLFTLVTPGQVVARTTVPEASAFSVAEGQAAKVRPGPAPRTSLAGRVARVARVSGGTDYEVLVDVTGADARLMPGHTCKVQITTADKPSALTVPAAAVESEGDKRFVRVVGAGGEPERREVEVGETSGGRTEILSGVAEGDRVVAAAPKGK